MADFGIGELLTGLFSGLGAGGAAAGAAEAAAAGSTLVEGLTVTAPLLASAGSGLGALGTAAGLGFAGAGLAGGFGGGGGGGGAAGGAAPDIPITSQPLAPAQTNPANAPSLNPQVSGLTGAPKPVAGTPGPGGTVSATSTAAPQGTSFASPDITSAGSSSVNASLPGDVLKGAATGAPSDTVNLAAGLTAPTPPGGGLGGAVSGAANAVGKAGSSVLSSVEKNPLQALELGILGSSLLRGNAQPQGTKQLNTAADQAANEARLLESYLTSGNLPPGEQAALTAAGKSAEATIRSEYAARGMSGSSAEAQDLSNAKLNTAAKGADLASQLFSQGVQESQISADIYSQLINQNGQQDQATSSAVSNFVQALALSGRPVSAGAEA